MWNGYLWIMDDLQIQVLLQAAGCVSIACRLQVVGFVKVEDLLDALKGDDLLEQVMFNKLWIDWKI